MNKQEVIDKLRAAIPDKTLDDYQRVEEIALTYTLKLVEELGKVTVPQFVADWYEANKEGFENNVYDLCVQFNNDNEELNKEIRSWFNWPVNKPIQTLVNMHQFGYEVEKEKLYRAKNRHTGEYLCYCFGLYHDKNSSSENKRFTAEEKRWKELGYWDNDLYIFEEVEGEDEDE